MKKDSPIRLIDAQTVSHLRSQTIYHALAYAMKPGAPDTVVLSRPGSRYACVGFHQDAARELDLDFCRAQQIPVIRRETGGGTVLIDPNQLFVQWIFQPEHLPRKIDTRFQLFVKPLIETYQFFGIKAYAFPPNDVHVNGKKIVGTGAAAIGNAEVVTGNFMLDFDVATMADILRVPNEPFRDLFRQSLGSYLTSMKKELEIVPDLEELKRVYGEKCQTAAGRILEPGAFTQEELDWMENLDAKFSSEEWLLEIRKPQAPERLVKVHAGVWIGDVSYMAGEKEIKATIRTRDNRIDRIALADNAWVDPPARARGMENILHNVEMEEEDLREVLEAFFELHSASTPGISPDDWIGMILKMKRAKLKMSGG